MASGQVFIIDNAGDNSYYQTSREFLSNPIKVDMLKVLLDNEDQIYNNIQIRNKKSFGSEWNREIQLKNYQSALDKTNLIVDVPISPPITIDGNTYFRVTLEADSEMILIFYFDQSEVVI